MPSPLIRLGVPVALGLGLVSLSLLQCGGCDRGETAANGGSTADVGGDSNDPDVVGHDRPPLDALDEPTDGPSGDGDIFTDPRIWKAQPDDKGCGLYVAEVAPVPFPKRAWTSCGPGCRVAPAALPAPTPNGVYTGPSSAGEREGRLIARLRVDSPLGLIEQVLRLDDEVTLAAVQVRQLGCSLYGHGQDTPFFTLLGTPSSLGPIFVRAVSFSPPVKFGPWLNDVGLVASLFSWDAGWGVAFDSGDIGVIMPFEGQAWTPIDTGAAAFRAVARRDLVLWRSYQTTRHVVRGYTSAGGTKNYWTPPEGFSVKSVALSDTTLAWVVASGPDVDHSTWPYTTARLYWALYTTDPAALAPKESVELPKADLIYLKTGGGFAVTRGGILSDLDAEPKGVYPLVVVELASERSWQIFPAQNTYWIAEVMAISKDLLFVGRGDSSKNDPQSLHELVVFDLSQLDAIAQSSAPN